MNRSTPALELASAAPQVHPGDIVRTGTNCTPIFWVVAVQGDMTWVREDQTDKDYIIPVARCEVLGHRPECDDGPSRH